MTVAPRQREVAPGASPVEAAELAGVAEPPFAGTGLNEPRFRGQGISEKFGTIVQPVEAGTKHGRSSCVCSTRLERYGHKVKGGQ